MGLCEWLLAEGMNVACALFVATAYTDYDGTLTGVTASGVRTRPGVAACGPSWEFGTVVVLRSAATTVPKLGQAVTCLDRGGGVGDRDVDLWLPTRREALRFGRRGMRGIIFIVDSEGERVAEYTARMRYSARTAGPTTGSALPLRSTPVWRGTSLLRGAWHPSEVHPGETGVETIEQEARWTDR